MGHIRILRGRRFAGVMGLCSIALSALISFRLSYLFPSAHHAWLTPTDGWATTNSTQYLLYGGAASLYSANLAFLTLPGFLIVYAPVVAIGDHLGLLPGYPFPIPRPSMWLVSGPFFFICGAAILPALDYLAEVLGVSRPRRRWLSFLVALVISVPISALAGHPEDALALALTCVSLGLLIEGRLPSAGATLTAAVLMQTWAGLLIPLFFAVAPPGRRLAMLIRTSLLPAALGLLLLALDFKDASMALLHQPMTGVGERLPWWSMAARVRVDLAGHERTVVAGSSSRILAVVTAVAAAYLVRRGATPERIMLAAAVVLYSRGLFESEFWPYYLAPAAVLFAVLAASRTAGSPKRFVAVLMGAFLLYASAPMAYVGVQYPAALALAILLTTGAICTTGCFPEAAAAIRRRIPRFNYAG